MQTRIDHRARLMPLFRELGHLKRITSAGRHGSIATRLFKQAWCALCAGDAPKSVMRQTVGAAVAAGRLGDLDSAKLVEIGLTAAETVGVLRAGFDAVGDVIEAPLAVELREALAGRLTSGPLPLFAALLADQPRAGVTCPGKPRLMLLPAENHAEHSIAVAVYGVLVSAYYDADPVMVFLAGLGHHFHNAAMPDSGLTGEMLLGDLLGDVIVRLRGHAMSELSSFLQAQMEDALKVIADDSTPEGRAFHAGDVIDRVIEIEQHVTSSRLTMDMVLHDYELVHAGPVKTFHDLTLREVGLL